MSPTAPASNPTSTNTNMAYGGFGQVNNDNSLGSSILNYLPTQEANTTSTATKANTNPGDILPNISINAPTYTAPTIPVINAAGYGSNLSGYNSAVQSAEQGLTSQENSTMSSAMGNLSSAESQYGNLTPVYQKLASAYNIPGYQADIGNLTTLLQNLSQDVNTQTTLGGGAVTQSARDERYTNMADPLNKALTSAGTFLNYGQNDVNNLLGTYEKSLTNALTPLETNISNLPGQFSQANSAAESGYQGGATSIQDQIQNQIQQEQANTYATQISKEFGGGSTTGGSANVINSLSGTGNNGQLLPGVTFKNSQQGAKSGFNFSVGNTPVSAATWAAANANQFGQGTDGMTAIKNMLYSMATAGDSTANQAYTAIENNKGVITPQIYNQYSSVLWGMPGFANSAPTTPTPPKPMTTNQIAQSDLPGNGSNILDYAWNQLTHPSQWW